MRKISVILFLMTVRLGYAQKFENLAMTPPMGWNSWNTFKTKIDEKLVMEVADNMLSSGMKDAGYTYIVLDDGWMSMERDSTGNLVADPAKFPHGMKALVDYVHSKGLRFGLYNCAGTKTCAGYPGTRGYEYQDARLYAALGIDYLKFDWCHTDGINAREAYSTMSKALRAAGRPIVFSLCEWGQNQPWEWASPLGQLWRTTGDVDDCFEGTFNHGTWSGNCVMKIVDIQKDLRKYAGPGHWNDPDMLEVGNGMKAGEDRAHFSLWCMLAAPLMAGNDVRGMTSETQKILCNKDVIAIDQDKLGIQAFNYSVMDSVESWFKPLEDGGWAVCFVNRSRTSRKISFDWNRDKVHDELSSRNLDLTGTGYRIKDLWNRTSLGNTSSVLKAEVPPHDVLMVKLSK